MTYLRFTPEEYGALRSHCSAIDLTKHDLSAFRRLLPQALRRDFPQLAQRTARLGQAKAQLLYFHFRPRTSSPREHKLSADEVQILSKVCREAPFRVRMVRQFKGVIVELLEALHPELAPKVDSLSSHQFERLYNQAVGRAWWHS